MNAVAEIEAVSCPRLTSLYDVVVLLHDKVISHLIYWKQALHTSIHIAVECVVFETHNAIFKLW